MSRSEQPALANGQSDFQSRKARRAAERGQSQDTAAPGQDRNTTPGFVESSSRSANSHDHTQAGYAARSRDAAGQGNSDRFPAGAMLRAQDDSADADTTEPTTPVAGQTRNDPLTGGLTPAAPARQVSRGPARFPVHPSRLEDSEMAPAQIRSVRDVPIGLAAEPSQRHGFGCGPDGAAHMSDGQDLRPHQAGSSESGASGSGAVGASPLDATVSPTRQPGSPNHPGVATGRAPGRNALDRNYLAAAEHTTARPLPPNAPDLGAAAVAPAPPMSHQAPRSLSFGPSDGAPPARRRRIHQPVQAPRPVASAQPDVLASPSAAGSDDSAAVGNGQADQGRRQSTPPAAQEPRVLAVSEPRSDAISTTSSLTSQVGPLAGGVASSPAGPSPHAPDREAPSSPARHLAALDGGSAAAQSQSGTSQGAPSQQGAFQNRVSQTADSSQSQLATGASDATQRPVTDSRGTEFSAAPTGVSTPRPEVPAHVASASVEPAGSTDHMSPQARSARPESAPKNQSAPAHGLVQLPQAASPGQTIDLRDQATARRAPNSPAPADAEQTHHTTASQVASLLPASASSAQADYGSSASATALGSTFRPTLTAQEPADTIGDLRERAHTSGLADKSDSGHSRDDDSLHNDTAGHLDWLNAATTVEKEPVTSPDDHDAAATQARGDGDRIVATEASRTVLPAASQTVDLDPELALPDSPRPDTTPAEPSGGDATQAVPAGFKAVSAQLRMSAKAHNASRLTPAKPKTLSTETTSLAAVRGAAATTGSQPSPTLAPEPDAGRHKQQPMRHVSRSAAPDADPMAFAGVGKARQSDSAAEAISTSGASSAGHHSDQGEATTSATEAKPLRTPLGLGRHVVDITANLPTPEPATNLGNLGADGAPSTNVLGLRSSRSRVDGVDLRHHGDNEVGHGLIDLAVNVRSEKPPTWLYSRLLDALSSIAHYPKADAARAAIAVKHRVRPDQVLVTNGAAEAFSLLAQAISPRWAQTVTVVHPQFSEPERAVRAAGHRVQRLLCDPAQGFALDPARIAPDSRVVFVGNPTNPTGVVHTARTLRQIADTGRLVIVDEAFMDATDQQEQSLIGSGSERIIIIRSLTKTWGIAGIRAGYMIGPQEFITAASEIQPHWSVNSLAAAATEVCMSPQADAAARELRDSGLRARDDLLARLTDLGRQTGALDVPVTPAVPFVLVRVRNGAAVHTAMRERGWAIRSCASFPGLGSNWWRIAARDIRTHQRFIRALALELDNHR